MRVLIVDDHAEVLALLERTLLRDGHVVRVAASCSEARHEIDRHDTDLLILDLGLPDGSGEALCHALRREGRDVLILVLTAKNEVSSRVRSLDAGADDYLGKPFAVAEVRARVRALGRRMKSTRTFVWQLGDVVLDFSARRAQVAGRQAPITAREWSILELLAARGGGIVERSELLSCVWGEANDAASASLDVLIARIRRKLSNDVVRTVRGSGYGLGSP